MSAEAKDFDEVVEVIVKNDHRYAKDAYHFVRRALDHTLKKVKKSSERKSNHVDGRELCEGIREYALEQYGPMSRLLLNEWGLYKTDDFGEIVFNLVEYDVFGVTPEDKREDFSNIFDFKMAFEDPFIPRNQSRFATLNFDSEFSTDVKVESVGSEQGSV